MLKVKKGMILRQIRNQNLVIPTGAMVDEFKGMIRLNEMGVYYWKKLVKGAEPEELLEEAAADCPDADKAVIKQDLDEFLDSIRFALEEEE
jgi:hypothetical protein